MTVHPVGRVICKLAAVFLFVEAVRGVTWVVPQAFDTDRDFITFGIGFLFVIAAPTFGGILLWIFADRIARTEGDVSYAGGTSTFTQDDMLEAGVILIGVYAVVFGFIAGVNLEVADWMIRTRMPEILPISDEVLARHWARRIEYLVQIGLGVGLIYGRASLLRIFHKARRIGTGAPEQ